MRRADWTPAVLVTATASVTVVLIVLLNGPWMGAGGGGRPGPERPRRVLAPELTIWVGDLGGGLKGVLGAVYGDRTPDREHDAVLNQGLALGGADGLGYYRLLVFNLSEEPRELALVDGAIGIRTAEGEVRLRSLAGLIAAGKATPSPALRTVLASLGTLSERIGLDPGQMASLVVAFDAHVELDEAAAVETADGAAFRRRRMQRRDLEALIEQPDEARVRDL